jgi:hypothetical protein
LLSEELKSSRARERSVPRASGFLAPPVSGKDAGVEISPDNGIENPDRCMATAV